MVNGKPSGQLPGADQRPVDYTRAYTPRRGLSIPSITVLDESGRLVEDQQRRVFRYNAQDGFGADIIFAGGTTGEANRILNSDRRRLIQVAADEVGRINARIQRMSGPLIEVWAGITGGSRAETLSNLECALDSGVDAAVVSPLSIPDLGDVLPFFQRDINNVFERRGDWVPIFLYDNADISVDPHNMHIRTRDVKWLSRLPFIYGIKVSASRRVLGNYTKGALHFNDKGEFGVYIGNAMLMFQVFQLKDGVVGLFREYWNRYLLHNELPVGVVSGPANVFPREWQRAWRACFAAEEALVLRYRAEFERFNRICVPAGSRVREDKMIACLKYALRVEGVIDSDVVAPGTPTLEEDERRQFLVQYRAIKDALGADTVTRWTSQIPSALSRAINKQDAV